MARVINANYATLYGTPEQVMKFLRLLHGGAAIVNLNHARIVLGKKVAKPKVTAKSAKKR